MTTTGSAPGRSVPLGDLLGRVASRGVELLEAQGTEIAVGGVCEDSRQVTPGDLFAALPGTKAQGASYVADAVAAGASAVLVAADDSVPVPDCVAVVRAADVRRAYGYLASAFFEDPCLAMDLVGVTGTNGKTSCSHLLEHVLLTAGRSPGVIGTIATRWPGFERQSSMTTPPAGELHQIFSRMRDAGCDSVAMEVSSHALTQGRIEGCEFRAALFTNLTRDHLDYHGTEDAYFAAKASLLRNHLAPENGAAILNADDPMVAGLASELRQADVWEFSTVSGSTTRARVLRAEVGLDGIRAVLGLDADEIEIESRLLGAPNLSNLCAIAATAAALGVPVSAIEAGLSSCAAVPGRLERIGEGRPHMLVDYAHTPDALERTLASLVRMTEGRLICVFGCGGDRDRGKRAMMGEVAATLADVVVITSDNPRTEDPMAIIAQIAVGLEAEAEGSAPIVSDPQTLRDVGSGVVIEPDREAAIRIARSIASPRDVVLIAGKGHEDYQEVHGVRKPFDDRRLVGELKGASR